MAEDRKTQLVALLAESDEPLTIADIQARLGVSRRTVINYVAELNHAGSANITSSRRGYTLASDSPVTAHAQRTAVPSSREERQTFLIQQLLFLRENKTVDELAAQVFVSSATLTNELNRLKSRLRGHGLHISVKRGIPFVVGQERDRRRFVGSLLTDELQTAQFRIESMQRLFPHAQLDEIRSIVIRAMDHHRFTLDDYSLQNYVLQLAASVESAITDPVAADEGSASSTLPAEPFSPHVAGIVDEVRRELVDLYDVSFTPEQIYDSTALVATRIVSQRVRKMSPGELDEIVGQETATLLKEIVGNVRVAYGIDLDDPGFATRFAIHLKNAIVRARGDLALPDNRFISVKDDFPFLYVVAVYIAAIISRHLGQPLPQGEIAYIALHVGVLMEERRAREEKVTCVLVMHDYGGLARTVFDNLDRLYGGALLADVVSDYSHIDLNSPVDLIITTLAPDPDIPIPQVHVSLIPTAADYTAIIARAQEVQRGALSGAELAVVRRLFREELFIVSDGSVDDHGVIETLSDRLIAGGFVEPSYRASVYEHESYVPSAYGRIAIPHPLSSDDHEIRTSAVAALISRDPIQWYGNQVNIVFMLALRPDDAPLFREVFSFITHGLSSDAYLRQLLRSENFSEFIRTLTAGAST
jgi:lichenan operon transcriptional antiterminator